MTKYLGKEPIVFAMRDEVQSAPRIVERGGLPAPIAKKDRCPSGRHNLRLTSCYCEVLRTAADRPKRRR